MSAVRITKAQARQWRILNLGAGVQSTTLYLMAMQGEVEPIDCAIFADTGEEPRAVYRHLEWLQSLGGPPVLVRTAGVLGEDLIHGMVSRKGFAQIPAFTSAVEGDPLGMTRRQCTKEYKTQVIERTIRRDVLGLEPGRSVPTGVKVIQCLGLSLDEPRRIIAVKARFQSIRWAEPRFPLFDLEMTRRDCQAWLAEQNIPHEVPRSACVFCPFHTNAEWRRIRANPADWQRACEVDEAMRSPEAVYADKLNQKLYVHRSCVPLRQANIDTPETRGEQYVFGFAQECEGMCGV